MYSCTQLPSIYVNRYKVGRVYRDHLHHRGYVRWYSASNDWLSALLECTYTQTRHKYIRYMHGRLYKSKVLPRKLTRYFGEFTNSELIGYSMTISFRSAK